jgi:outer membrane protein assembly factor BamB
VSQTLRIIGLSVATLLLASCSLFGDKEEELQPKELVDFQSTLKIKRLWSTKLGGASEFLLVGLRPVSDGNRIYAASQDGNVFALDPETGRERWKTKLDLPLSAGPAANEGSIVVASKDGYVIVLDAATGVEQWRTFIAGEALARPLIQGDTIVVQTIDSRLRAFSRFDGRQRWAIEQTPPVLTMRGAASPLLVGSLVIAGFDNGRLLAVDVNTGDIEWESMLAMPTGRSDLDRLSDINGAIAVVGQDLYAAGYQGRIAALAAESGQVLWSKEISSQVGVAADWNSVYTTRDNGEIIALSRSDGSESWRSDDLLRRDPTLPVPFYTTAVVGDFEGYLHFFSNLDGAAVARVRFGKHAITSDPLVVANRLFVQSDNGSLAAFEVVEDRPQRPAPDIADES